MKKIFYLLAVVFLAIGNPAIVLQAQAQTAPTIPGDTENNVGFPYWGPLVSCEGSVQTLKAVEGINASSGQIKNYCRDFCDILATIQRITYFAITVVILVVAPILLVVGGLLMIVTGTSQDMIKIGKAMVKNTIIGIVVALVAFIIINTFLWIFAIPKDESGSGGLAWPQIKCSVPNPSQLFAPSAKP